ncbi:hypothetical protein ACFSX9_13585 [Flavobacterium ardleyense]|uniref:Uncharacterized protein n=1 Tax=Flavobacterium ardleyense TaxID=2038737 RepID=A0ABW5ZA51_9FLAO
MFYFLILLYTIWIFLTIVKQFDKSIFKLSKYDIFALIPNWKLFAPNPKYSDYKIFYRDKFLDGSISDLIEIDWINNKTKNFLWKGQMREQKFLSLVSKDVYKYREKKIDLMFFFDIKTIMLKNYIRNYRITNNIITRQLIVVETYGHLVKREELIVFVTDIKYNKNGIRKI